MQRSGLQPPAVAAGMEPHTQGKNPTRASRHQTNREANSEGSAVVHLVMAMSRTSISQAVSRCVSLNAGALRDALSRRTPLSENEWPRGCHHIIRPLGTARDGCAGWLARGSAPQLAELRPMRAGGSTPRRASESSEGRPACLDQPGHSIRPPRSAWASGHHSRSRCRE